MRVHNSLQQLPAFRHAVVTIGTFDGVHGGHRQIIAQLKAEAKRRNGESVLITFYPHPRQVLHSGEHAVKLINTLPEKLALLESLGLDHVVVVPFDADFANQSAEDYIEKFLVALFQPACIIIGYDHRFGKNRSGDFALLKARQEQFGYELVEIPAEVLQDAAISSTKIRKALQENDMVAVNACLGYPYFFEGQVIEGNKLGRKLGYPTANIGQIDPDKMLPGNGVYATLSQINHEGPWLPGMMNIGMRPTVDGTRLSVEVHLFDFDQDIYHQPLTTLVMGWLRSEQKFEGLDKLVEQLGQDAEAAKATLASLP